MAAALAKKSNEEVSETHLKKAKSQGITLMVMGILLVGVGVVNLLMIAGVIQAV